MRAWLGEPEQFADPKFDTIAARYAASTELNALIAELFADRRRWTNWSHEGQSRGRADRRGAHARRRRWPPSTSGRSARSPTSTSRDGADVTVPAGPFVVDGGHAGFARPGPAGIDDTGRWLAPRTDASDRTGDARGAAAVRRAADPRPRRHRRRRRTRQAVRRPRCRGHQGRERRLSRRAAPDAARSADEPIVGADPPQRIRSLGLDLRSTEGAELFRRLVADADAVFANFKPGTLAVARVFLRRAARR